MFLITGFEKNIIDALNGLPPELVVIFISMVPVSELRGAIPVATQFYGMDPGKAYFLSVIGNTIPVIPLLLFLGIVERFLRAHFRIFDIFFTWLFERTRNRVGENVKKYGALGLIPFVAIPLPVTGAWTGVAAAYVFGIKFKHAFPAIFLGILIAGVIVTLTTLGVKSLF